MSDQVFPPAGTDLSTAYALALFRDELEARGFPDEQAAALVQAALAAEVQRTGLAVTITPPNPAQ